MAETSWTHLQTPDNAELVSVLPISLRSPFATTPGQWVADVG